MNLYRTLEKLPNIEDRRKLIDPLLKTLDLSEILPKGVRLTGELSMPSQDQGISLPFAVGHKYEIDEPYEPFMDHNVFVLGICRVNPGVIIPSFRSPDSTGFLVVDSKGEIEYAPRNCMTSLDLCAIERG